MPRILIIILFHQKWINIRYFYGILITIKQFVYVEKIWITIVIYIGHDVKLRCHLYEKKYLEKYNKSE